MYWRSPRVIAPVALIAIVFSIYFAPAFAGFVYQALVFLSPVWLPALLAYLAWPLWLAFARSQFSASIPYITLELKPGVETPRTARPMELVFHSLYHRTEITKRDYLLGQFRPSWSFELYAHSGKIRFFVHVPKNHRQAVETRIQGEYHDIEIEEVRDYSREIPFNASSHRAITREYTLSKPDPYPLKTFESHEAEGRDVFGEMLEQLATVGEHEHLLISYMVRPHQRERFSYFEDPRDTLHEDARHVIEHIVGSHGEVHSIAPAQQAVVAAIESALKKPSFDCGVRALYIAPRKGFTEDIVQTLDTLLSRFDDENLNGFSAYDPVTCEGFFKKESFALSSHLKAEHVVHLYRRRAFFAPPYIGEAFVLNTEELATLFHMPHAGRGTLLAHRAHVELEPPVNLPV